ncbi:hypothetical protein EXIGLDRAFT_749093 [Exidia glandulosa HHB12029]|uniref:Protein kinase domain-containing protein n=1 Tax=Exidia glandulosa HHB12029 TaxID=1314781 RepID=A0A165ILB4_EXIGL|nr:hypothetical protein EXIGLDRAFT_749093 [Exidia glandulosa HHB12029]
MANATEVSTRNASSGGSCDGYDHEDNASPLHAEVTDSLTPLRDYLARNLKADRRLLMQHVAIQLAMYHDVQKLVYGDVKMANVMVNEHGVATLLKSEKSAPITSHPRAPTSPEERLPMTTATDLYAFAWLVFHVYTDVDPQAFARDSKTMNLIASGVKPNRPGPQTVPTLRGLNNKIWEMLLKCWSISPIERPKATEVLHAFDLDLEI